VGSKTNTEDYSMTLFEEFEPTYTDISFHIDQDMHRCTVVFHDVPVERSGWSTVDLVGKRVVLYVNEVGRVLNEATGIN
jgi:hypothetical protein